MLQAIFILKLSNDFFARFILKVIHEDVIFMQKMLCGSQEHINKLIADLIDANL